VIWNYTFGIVEVLNGLLALSALELLLLIFYTRRLINSLTTKEQRERAKNQILFLKITIGTQLLLLLVGVVFDGVVLRVIGRSIQNIYLAIMVSYVIRLEHRLKRRTPAQVEYDYKRMNHLLDLNLGHYETIHNSK
jgi:hypothetical protein